MGRKSIKADIYRAEREKGLTYAQIAEKYGVTRQRVGQACGKGNPRNFQFVKKEGCIYINLRDWMNSNKVSRAELVRRIGLEPVGKSMQRFGTYISGRSDPPKYIIDSMINVTGLSYEALFEIG